MRKALRLPVIIGVAALAALAFFFWGFSQGDNGSKQRQDENVSSPSPATDDPAANENARGVGSGSDSGGVEQPRGVTAPPDPVIITDPVAPTGMGGVAPLPPPVAPPVTAPPNTGAEPPEFDEPDPESAAPPDERDEAQRFPWPPPPPSAMQTLPRGAFIGETMATVSDRLEAALDEAGYFEKRYHELPGKAGFVLMTRLEQFSPDGASLPEPDRWSAKIPPLRSFSLGEYIKRLFKAPRGFYRVIVFAVTDDPIRPQGDAPDREAINSFFAGGASGLSPDLRDEIYTRRHGVTALIYEFEKPDREAEALFVERSNLPARQHLEKARLWEALAVWR